ncbi:MAG: hypothetical protein K8W52_13690 [Deltaproteobacteria bacterium]|nr:hypothetical protein [Deltaproteobacteria bacterium]
MAEHEGGGAGGFLEKYILPAAHVAEHFAEPLMHSGVGATVGKALPFLGAAIGGGQAAYHGYEMMQHTDQAQGSYANNEFYTEMGEATLGGAGAAASFCPPAALYLGAGELALNGLGALSGAVLGDDYSFSAGSVVGGIEHGVADAGAAIGGAASSAWDTVTSW